MGRSLTAVFLLLAAGACDCSDDRGGGGGRDAGPRDGGAPTDTGAGSDAPEVVDAGPPEEDAGPASDAGSASDAGPADAGLEDAGERECPGADRPLVRTSFTQCADGMHVGQTMPAPGATCEQVCCIFGFAGCVHRAAQADFDACTPESPDMSGSCADVFMPLWSSQCLCAGP